MYETILNQDQEVTVSGIFRPREGKRLEITSTIKRYNVGTKFTRDNAKNVPGKRFDRNSFCHFSHFHSSEIDECCKRSWSSDRNQHKWNSCEIQDTSEQLFEMMGTVNYNQNSHENFSRQSRNKTPSSTTPTVKNSPFTYRYPLPVPPAFANRSAPSLPVPCVYSSIVSPCKIIQSTPASMLKTKSMMNYESGYTEIKANNAQAVYDPNSKFIHRKCTPKQPNVQWAPERNSNRTEFGYRNGFRAYSPKKEMVLEKLVETSRPTVQKFAVKDLGVTYFLSDRNENLAKRHISIPKCYTYNLQSRHPQR